MWVSNYTIYVPIPNNSRYLLVHGYTGAIDIVDTNLAFALQDCFSTGSPISTLALPSDILHRLEQRGYLTDLSLEEEVKFVSRLSKKLYDYDFERTVFWIIPSYECQLRCKYCFERPIQNKGEKQGWLSQNISNRNISSAYSAMRELMGNKPNKQITIYGGEPLLPKNHETIAEILDQGSRLGFHFVSLTNGVDVDAYTDLLGPGKIEELHITLDGPQITHDQLRVRANGLGTFKRIADNVELALNRGSRVLLRVNVTWDVLARLHDMIEIVKERGWEKRPGINIYCQAIYASKQYQTCASPYSFQKLQPFFAESSAENCLGFIDNKKIAQYIYRAGWDEYFTVDLQVSDITSAILTGNPINALKPSGCHSQSSWYIFDPFGNIYCCSNQVGDPRYRIGVFTPKLKMNDNLGYWRGRVLYNLPNCKICRYALYCAGGCAQQDLISTGDPYTVDCKSFPQRFEASLIAGYLRKKNFLEVT